MKRSSSICSIVCLLFALGCSAGKVQLLTVTGVTPADLTAGTADTLITVTGNLFNRNMSVVVGTAAVQTAFISSMELRATIPSARLVNGASYAISIYDDEGAGRRSTLATPFTLQITNPVPVAISVTPSSFITEGTGATAVVSGSGLLPTTTAQIDGSTRAITYSDANHVSVALTSSDLLFATQHSLVLSNAAPGGGSTAPLALHVVNLAKGAASYTAYGDSITFGKTLASVTQAYPYQVAQANGLTLRDAGLIGDQACDLFPHQILPSQDGFVSSTGHVFSLMIGTNDVNQNGIGAYEPVFKSCHQAAMAWLSLPRSSKVLAGDADLVARGGCVDRADASHLQSLYCATTGTISDTAFASYGKPLYVWYVIDDAAPATATFDLEVDGASVGSFSTAMTPAIRTMNGVTSSIALLRVPLAAGFHTVTMRAPNGGVGLLGLGTVPSVRSGLSFLVAGDLPVQLVSKPYASAAAQMQYSADVLADVALLQSDGLDIRFAPTRQFMLGSNAEMSDEFHPNLLGQTHLAAAFQTGFDGINAAGPTAMDGRTPSAVTGAALAHVRQRFPIP